MAERRTLRLTTAGRTLICLAALAIGAAWTTGESSARLAASLLLTPLLIDWWWKWRWPRVGVQARQRRAHAGQSFVEDVSVTNSSRRAVQQLRLIEPRTATRAGVGWCEHLAGNGNASITLQARARMRGMHATRSFVLETTHPFGLLRLAVLITCDARLLVEPARVDMSFEHPHAVDVPEPETSSGEQPEADEFHSLREYADGEDVRHVHALRSAARGGLVRRVVRGQQENELLVVLDLRRPPSSRPRRVLERPRRELERQRDRRHDDRGHDGGSGRDDRARRDDRAFEWSLGAAATLSDETIHNGGRMTCLVLAQDCVSRSVQDADSASAFLEFLSQAKAVPFAVIGQDRLEPLQERAVLWIPAGGHRAENERRTLRARLVTEADLA